MSLYNEGSPSHSLSGSGAQEAIDLDPSTAGSFLSGDPKRHDDLRAMLDSSKESLKLEAMKRIIGMVARGRDVGDLFPAVVKNVVSKNIEIKKLVYVYLTRYAEEQQDVALLSISTFQRALKDPNQLIRASALRVLSSIRVPMIVPIVMLAIRDSAVDMSPFVRKTAAHAIPKAYSIDPDQKEELVGIIEKLLGDRTTLVVGSAVMAFEEVCPERTELIHKQFRKLCHLLVDVEEWGQVIIVNMLLRYARTQFLDPNDGQDLDVVEDDSHFYDDDDSDSENETKKKKKPRTIDADHRLLLKSAKPLLQSRNAAVVMATAQLYYHCAPKAEVQGVAKAMIRLLRSHTEVQAIVLNCIASMTSKNEKKSKHSMFEPHLKNFFVRSVDPSHIKILKLEIMTNLATEGNIGIILREFQSYITSQDKICVAATIQAIGRCAAAIDDVTDTCLNGLVQLLSNRDQAVVAESVVVIKKLLQTQAGDHKEIIFHMAKLMDTIKVPAARAAILWVLGEYSERVPKVAPDVLRKLAKSFINEETEVKMQILNLATKLVLVNPEQTELLAQYVFNLAKYDKDYDLRDRARFMKAFVFPPPGHENNPIIKHAKKIFLATKPAPSTESRFKDREMYQLGSMSHYLNSRAPGYHDLPGFPDVAPDPSVRNVEPIKAPNPWEKTLAQSKAKEGEKGKKKKQKFYSDDSNTSDSDSDSGSSDSDFSSSGSESDSESSSSEDEPKPQKREPGKKEQQSFLLNVDDFTSLSTPASPKAKPKPEKESESSSSSSESSDVSSSEESSESEPEVKPKPKKKAAVGAAKKKEEKPKTNLDLLLSLDDDPPTMSPSGGVLTPSIGGMLTPVGSKDSSSANSPIMEIQPTFIPSKGTELLNKISTGGLQLSSRYTRSPHLYSPAMTNLELTFTNHGKNEMSNLRIGGRNLAPGMSLHEFPAVSKLAPNASVNVNLGINFNDTTQSANFDVVVTEENGGDRCHKIVISPLVGELIRAVSMPESVFISEQKKLRGMNETLVQIDVPSVTADESSLKKRVFEVANVAQVPCLEPNSQGLTLRFAGKTVANKHVVLITMDVVNQKASLTVNCEKIVVGNLLAKHIKETIEQS